MYISESSTKSYHALLSSDTKPSIRNFLLIFEYLPSENEVLGQGNIFTSVCHSFYPHGWGSASRGEGSAFGGGSVFNGGLYRGKVGQIPYLHRIRKGYGRRVGGTHPTGMHSCLGIVYL